MVQGILIETLASGTALMGLLNLESVPATTIGTLIASAKTLADQINKADHVGRKALYKRTVRTITLSDDDITIFLNIAAFALVSDDTEFIAVTRPMSIRRRGHEMKMIIGGETPAKTNKDQGLIRLIAKAYSLRAGLEDGSMSSILEFANLHSIDPGDARRLLPLGYLAPDIVETIISGHQPADLTALKLKSGYDLPVRWTEQRVHLGISK